MFFLRCESEECLVRNSGSQSPQGEDMGCQAGGGVGGQVGGGVGGQDQAEEEEQMLGSQLAELQQKLDRSVLGGMMILTTVLGVPGGMMIVRVDVDSRVVFQDGG